MRLVARTRLLRWFNGGSDDTALLPLLLLKIMSVSILDTIVYSGMNDRTYDRIQHSNKRSYAGYDSGYDRMFGAIGLAVLSGLGRRSTLDVRYISPFVATWSWTLPIMEQQR